MDASRHLGPQFMSMDQIGSLESQIPGKTVAESYHAPERWDAYEQDLAKAKGYQSAEHYHAALKEHMAAHGQGDPIRVQDSTYLTNGHHRYYAAHELGWSHMEAEPFRIGPGRRVPGWDD